MKAQRAAVSGDTLTARNGEQINPPNANAGGPKHSSEQEGYT